MTSRKYKAFQIINDKATEKDDALTVEEALQININNSPLTITMRTPGNDEELVRGVLHSEAICNIDSSLNISFSKEKTNHAITIANVKINQVFLSDGYGNSRSFLSVSSCGICGQTELPEVKGTINNKATFDPSNLTDYFKKMAQYQATFIQTGGSHAAAAFSENGELLTTMEDIGRHNAVDKVIGNLLLSNRLKEAQTLLVSGRISYEIVVKAFRAKIPILAAVSAPSSLAVDYAKELGITLFGFCRKNKATCYSNTHRII